MLPFKIFRGATDAALEDQPHEETAGFQDSDGVFEIKKGEPSQQTLFYAKKLGFK